MSTTLNALDTLFLDWNFSDLNHQRDPVTFGSNSNLDLDALFNQCMADPSCLPSPPADESQCLPWETPSSTISPRDYTDTVGDLSLLNEFLLHHGSAQTETPLPWWEPHSPVASQNSTFYDSPFKTFASSSDASQEIRGISPSLISTHQLENSESTYPLSPFMDEHPTQEEEDDSDDLWVPGPPASHRRPITPPASPRNKRSRCPSTDSTFSNQTSSDRSFPCMHTGWYVNRIILSHCIAVVSLNVLNIWRVIQECIRERNRFFVIFPAVVVSFQGLTICRHIVNVMTREWP